MGWLSAIVIGFAVLGGVVFCVGCGYVAGFVKGWKVRGDVVEETKHLTAMERMAKDALNELKALDALQTNRAFN